MKLSWRWQLFTVFYLLATACTRRGGEGQNLKILHLPSTEDVKTLDPAMVNDTVSAEIMGDIFEGLYRVSYLGKMGDTEPALAEGPPHYSDQNKTVTIKIRPGVLYQDDPAFPNGKGREVTAQDFIYSFKRIGDPGNNSSNWWMFDDIVVGFNEWRDALAKASADQKKALFDKAVPGLLAPDSHTLVFKLKRPYPQLVPILSMQQNSPVAPEVVEKYGPEIVNHPVGTGPFRLKTMIRGSKIILAKNPTFREVLYPSQGTAEQQAAGMLAAAGKKLPFVDEAHYDIIKEEQPLWLKFRNGDLDIASIPKDNFKEAVDAKGGLQPEMLKAGYKLYKELSLTTWWIEFNNKDPLLQNVKLRRALSMAFDRQRSLELIDNNRGVLISSPLPPALEGGSSDPHYAWEYNLEGAKKMLAEAGYPGGKGLPELTFELRGPGTSQRQMAELLKDNYAKIGVKLLISANSFPEALEKLKTSRFQIMLGGWAADYPDAENFLANFYGPNAAPGTNSSNFRNAEFDKLYEKIRTELPGADRTKSIIRMVAILQEQAPISFYMDATHYFVTQPWIRNYAPNEILYGKAPYLDVERPKKQ